MLSTSSKIIFFNLNRRFIRNSIFLFHLKDIYLHLYGIYVANELKRNEIDKPNIGYICALAPLSIIPIFPGGLGTNAPETGVITNS